MLAASGFPVSRHSSFTHPRAIAIEGLISGRGEGSCGRNSPRKIGCRKVYKYCRHGSFVCGVWLMIFVVGRLAEMWEQLRIVNCVAAASDISYRTDAKIMFLCA